MLDFLTKIFRREESSKTLAKERLRLVLMSDRVALAPETFDLMKGEMLSVLQRYLDIDEHGIDVHFENAERRFMLYANVPVTNIKSSEQIENERQRMAVGSARNGNGSHQGVGAAPRRRRRRRRRNGAAIHTDAASGGAAHGEGAPTQPYAASGNGAMHPETDADSP